MLPTEALCAIAYRPCKILSVSYTQVDFLQKEEVMNIAIEPILALVIGLLILLVPRFLNYFVAVYLIIIGIVGLMHHPLTL